MASIKKRKSEIENNSEPKSKKSKKEIRIR